ncbi:MAG: ornithine carbamoyltransferase [Blastocatellia bacterium AA13]|nr:MAG: ornithine carbamoyltransferase [Blastocatellia bacterium AA13]
MARHILSISDLGPETLARLVNRALEISSAPLDRWQSLKGRLVGIYFRGSSTRTRTAFTCGAIRLGGTPIAYGPNDLQLATGESSRDTARTLAEFLDVLVIRTNESIEEMREMTIQNRMSIVNAMSDNEHPTQAVTDLVTLMEEFGRLQDIHVLYVGEGNNTASALALAASMTPGMCLTLVTPEGYGLPLAFMEDATRLGREHGSLIEQHHRIDKLPRNVDAVYATRWQTMGAPKADPTWRSAFEPFRITQAMMAEVSRPSGTIFLHDLPAVRGGDVDDEVLEGAQNRAFRQARHKLTGAMAILEWCVNP